MTYAQAHREIAETFDPKLVSNLLEQRGMHVFGSVVSRGALMSAGGFRAYHSREEEFERRTAEGKRFLAYDCGGDDPKSFTDYLVMHDRRRAQFAIQRPFDVGVTDFAQRFINDFQFYLKSVFALSQGRELSVQATLHRTFERNEILEYFGGVRDVELLAGEYLDLDGAQEAFLRNVKDARDAAIAARNTRPLENAA